MSTFQWSSRCRNPNQWKEPCHMSPSCGAWYHYPGVASQLPKLHPIIVTPLHIAWHKVGYSFPPQHSGGCFPTFALQALQVGSLGLGWVALEQDPLLQLSRLSSVQRAWHMVRKSMPLQHTGRPLYPWHLQRGPAGRRCTGAGEKAEKQAILLTFKLIHKPKRMANGSIFTDMLGVGRLKI